MDVIRIDRLELDCIVGIRPDERHREQRLRVDLAFHVDLRRAGREGRIAQTCDYDAAASETMAMLQFRRYRLMEMAAEELAAMLLGTHPVVEQVGIRLEKPGALAGRARSASVEVSRQREDFPTRDVQLAFGSSIGLLDTREAELCLLRLDRGATYQPEPALAQDLHFLVAGQAAHDDRVLEPFQPELAAGGTFQAPSNDRALLFRCRVRRPRAR
jgi:7,8-dihydroneopterin aldolase/epimerase/oxygenase